jgi:hypothetical protein
MPEEDIRGCAILNPLGWGASVGAQYFPRRSLEQQLIRATGLKIE